MVTRQLETEVEEIFRLIEEDKNFLLSGGAGSGKTYSLVQFIKETIDRNPTVKIACMTYTNSAVKEIEERVNHTNLRVSTIHDFLWTTIKSFQNELKVSLIELINDETVEKIVSPDGIVDENYYNELVDGIEYKGFTNIREGILSHDAVIILANYMFKKYTKLCDILKDRFKFILVDEYQDTNEKVVEIFLTHLKKSTRKNTIGFFGDAMQSIYDDGIGNLNEYIASEDIVEVQKRQNRRNPQLVITLANRLRTDELEQVISTDNTAPNMLDGEIKDGSVKFYYSTEKVENLHSLKTELNWNFDNVKETKELNLTHNLIATKAGFSNLMDIYDNDKILNYRDRIVKYIKDENIINDFSEQTFGEVVDELLLLNPENKRAINPTNGMQDYINSHIEVFEIGKNTAYELFSQISISKNHLLDKDKRDPLINVLFTIQHNVKLYQERKYNEFLRQTEYQIRSIEDKQNLKNIIDILENMSEKSIEEIISYASENNLCTIEDDKYQRFIEEEFYVYNQVKELKYKVFQDLYDYVEDYTPFSTQHKIKGAEFNNVLVVLDNGNWRKYNFENLFLKNGSESVLERTEKIFYVCCTRAKENLVVFYDSPSDEVLVKAREWFGEGNIIMLEEL
ncbi:MAG TPA: ATP-dependent helicase [Arcobacter sp.]|nr:ATP-dependent helicase [Arcobacter sp.]